MDKGEIKKSRVDQAIHRAKMKIVWWVVGILAIVAAITAGGIWYSKSRSQNLPGAFYPEQGREHVPLDDKKYEYNSNPPTSGWHFAKPANWGVYKEEMDDRILIHNLEHGGVWISYKPEIPDDIKKKLESYFEKYGTKVIVTPRKANDADIVLAVWTRLEKFSVSEFSEERVDNFIRRLRNKTAPEPMAP